MTAAQTYDEELSTLSEASVNVHFDAFADIAWDHPDYAIDPHDPRWVLPEAHPLGGHRWYRELPLERQIEIGLWIQANIAKTGLQFENILIRGVMYYVSQLPNGSAEYRYLTHEVTEETHHTQMFQEFVNRAGVDAPGGQRLFRRLGPLLALVPGLLPEQFITGILAGEEPIDHIQRSILRSGDDIHPLLERIMQIHIAEEARHISFAHRYIGEHAPRLNLARRTLLSVTYPIIMRWLCDVIVVPPQELRQRLGIPAWVIDELFWDTPASQQMLRDLFADVRGLAEDAGLMNPVSRRVWRLLGIDGPRSRFRAEPAHPERREAA